MAKVLPIETKLPALYLREIGRIVTHWAYVEWRLHQIAYRLLDVSPKIGRIAIREPREPDYLDMIADLMTLNGLSIPPPVTQLRKDLDEYGRWRNWVSHSLWVRHPETKEYMIQITTGSWPKQNGKRRSRKELPEGIPIDLNKLRQIDGKIIEIGAQLEAFWRGVDHALKSSPEILRQRSQQQDRPLDHVAQRRKRPPRSFRA